MPDPSSHEVTQLLGRVRSNEPGAEALLISLVYQELRRLAAYYMKAERVEHTLQPTALVHEAYLKIFANDAIEWQNRAHFFAVAARQMRRLLVDHARIRDADKRGGGEVQITLSHVEVEPKQTEQREDILSVDMALSELEKQDPTAAHVVELKFFAGVTDQEAAEVLGLPFTSVRRHWEFARAWLYHRLSSMPSDGGTR
jgi:RNA polymerase sigma factor (TIGR02999 family)